MCPVREVGAVASAKIGTGGHGVIDSCVVTAATQHTEENCRGGCMVSSVGYSHTSVESSAVNGNVDGSADGVGVCVRVCRRGGAPPLVHHRAAPGGCPRGGMLLLLPCYEYGHIPATTLSY